MKIILSNSELKIIEACLLESKPEPGYFYTLEEWNYLLIKIGKALK